MVRFAVSQEMEELSTGDLALPGSHRIAFENCVPFRKGDDLVFSSHVSKCSFLYLRHQLQKAALDGKLRGKPPLIVMITALKRPLAIAAPGAAE